MKIKSSAILLISVIVLSITKNCDALDTETMAIEKNNSEDTLDSLIQENFNCTENTKSRKKRYVAFPDGSSFSVKTKKNKIIYPENFNFTNSTIGCSRSNSRVHRKSKSLLFQVCLRAFNQKEVSLCKLESFLKILNCIRKLVSELWINL